MINSFIHQALPTRVVFGAGSLTRVSAEVERLGAPQALVLSTPGRGEAVAQRVSALLGERSAGVFAGAVMRTPVETDRRQRCKNWRRATQTPWSASAGRPVGLRQGIGPAHRPAATRAADDLCRVPR